MMVNRDSFTTVAGILTNRKLLTNVQEYVDFVEYLRNRFDVDRSWYRGVSHAKYGLIPRVYRDRLWERHEDYEWWLCVDFENRARPFISDHGSYSHWEWYFTMQHYGLPTRLLDWTRGSLIALYFAVRRPTGAYIPSVYCLDPYWFDEVVYDKQSGEGVIYNTDAKAISDEHESRLLSYFGSVSESPPFPVCLEPPAIDARIQAQKSVFTLHGKHVNAFTTVARQNVTPHIAKLRFSTTRAEYLKCQLDGMGISEGTLFPGLEGLVRDIKWERGID